MHPRVDVIRTAAHERERRSGTQVTLLIVAMEKKVKSRPMYEIVSRLARCKELDICVLDKAMLLENPVEDWPGCDCLMAFSSTGYPLEKAEKYASDTMSTLDLLISGLLNRYCVVSIGMLI